jgi:beta-mannosidase
VRVISIALSCLFSVISANAQNPAPHRQSIDLGGPWEFRQASGADSTASWRPAQVPGDVHLDLLRNQLIPDPFFRQNEAKVQWIEDANWEYRKVFTVSDAMLAHRHVELVFDGLDTTATIYLNGHAVLDANNMFRSWRLDAKAYLHVGENTIQVEFLSDVKAGEKLAANNHDREQCRCRSAF